jgi:hypothetical protein
MGTTGSSTPTALGLGRHGIPLQLGLSTWPGHPGTFGCRVVWIVDSGGGWSVWKGTEEVGQSWRLVEAEMKQERWAVRCLSTADGGVQKTAAQQLSSSQQQQHIFLRAERGPELARWEAR